MNSKEVDLHIHSYFSDGTMSPKEILDEAIMKNLRALAIADHNALEGSKELRELSLNRNIKFISGVEIDTLDNEINYHILGYNFKLEDDMFNKFIEKTRQTLEDVSTRLITKMEKDYEKINLKEYSEYTYPKNGGGWKALHYFKGKKLTKELFDGYQFYAKYGPLYTTANFPNIQESIEQIHKANGIAILAHPGRVLKNLSLQEFETEVRRIVDLGIDGIECYYPTHSKEIIVICKKICKEYNLFITAGSDCHGTFENTVIGENNTEIGDINFNII